MPRELDPGQPHATHEGLIGAHILRRFKTDTARGGDDVILIYTVAADPNSADQHTVLVERHAARKDLDAIGETRNRWHTRQGSPAQGSQQRWPDERDLQAVIERAEGRDRF